MFLWHLLILLWRKITGPWCQLIASLLYIWELSKFTDMTVIFFIFVRVNCWHSGMKGVSSRTIFKSSRLLEDALLAVLNLESDHSLLVLWREIGEGELKDGGFKAKQEERWDEEREGEDWGREWQLEEDQFKDENEKLKKWIEDAKLADDIRGALVTEMEGKLCKWRMWSRAWKMELWVTRVSKVYHVASCRFTKPSHSNTALKYRACGKPRWVCESRVKSFCADNQLR